MVRLICPHCETELEIDEAFHGSVCRCYSCGSLLSVPESKSRKAADRPTERPEGPPGSDTGVFPAQPDPADALAGASGRSDDDDDAPGASATAFDESYPAGDDEDDVDVDFGSEDPEPEPPAAASRTASPPATAQPRRKPRKSPTSSRTTTVAALVISAVSLVLVLLFAYSFIRPAPAPQSIHEEIFGENVNPFLEGGPQYLGVPLSGTTVLILDTSEAMRDYFGYARDAAVLTVREAQGGHTLQVIAAAEAEHMVFPSQPISGDELSHEAVQRRLEQVNVGGGLALLDAVGRATASEPDLVIVTARLLPDVERVQQMIEEVEQAGAQLAVVLIDGEEVNAVTMIEDAGHNVVRIPGPRLRNWHEAWREQR